MKQYLLAVHSVEDAPSPSPQAMQKAFDDVAAFNTELQTSGAWVFAGGLHPASTATVVRAEGGDVLVTDGPFAETKEQLAGFYLIEVPNLEVALDWAARCPSARDGSIEVRPLASGGPA